MSKIDLYHTQAQIESFIAKHAADQSRKMKNDKKEAPVHSVNCIRKDRNCWKCPSFDRLDMDCEENYRFDPAMPLNN